MLVFIASLVVAAASSADVALARKALAADLGVAPDAIRLRSSREAQWADAVLGCAKKDEKPPAAATKGSEIVLEARGREYSVHVAGGRAVICGQSQSAGEERLDAAAALNLAAKRDLAERLKIDPERIETRVLRRTTWPDTGLGCPQPGMSYAQMETPGFLIELRAAGRTYTYHADRKRAVYCEEKPP